MKRTLLLSLFLLAFSISVSSAIDVQSLYKKLRRIDTTELMKLAAKYDRSNQPDSALVCYSLVSDRLSDTKLSREEEEVYCRALTNLGFL